MLRIFRTPFLYIGITLAIMLLMIVYVYAVTKKVEQDVVRVGLVRDISTDIGDATLLLKQQNDPKFLTPGVQELSYQLIAHVNDDLRILREGGALGGLVVKPVGDADIISMIGQMESGVGKWLALTDAIAKVPNREEFFKVKAEIDELVAELTDQSHQLHFKVAGLAAERQINNSYGVTAIIACFGVVIVLFIYLFVSYGRKLNLQNDELTWAMTELELQKQALDRHSIVAVTDAKGRITAINEKFCEISEYSRDELVGQDHRILNSGYHSKEYIKSLWQTISSGNVWHGELLNKAKSGRFYWVDTTIVPFMNDQGKPEKYVAIRTDITKRKDYERALYESERRLAKQNKALRELAVANNEVKELKELVYRYTETVASALRVGRVGVWLLDDDKKRACAIDVFDLQADSHDYGREIVIADNQEFFDFLTKSQTLSFSTLEGDGITSSLRNTCLELFEAKSLLCASIYVSGISVGFLSFESVARPRSWELDEQNFAASIVDFIAMKINDDERTRVEESLRVLAMSTPAISSKRFFAELVRQVAGSTGAEWVLMGEINRGRNTINNIAAFKEFPMTGHAPYVISGRPVSEIVNSQEAYVSENQLIQHPLIDDGESLTAKSYIEVPILTMRGEVSGIISVVNKRNSISTGLVESMLKICAGRVAAELERIRTQGRLEVLVDTMSDIIWEVNLDGVISYCSTNVNKVLRYDVSEMEGRSVYDFIDPQRVGEISAFMKERVAEKLPITNLEYSLVDRKGRKIHFLYNAIPLYDVGDNIYGYYGINTDITQLKETEAAIKIMAAAVDQSYEGIVITDIKGVIEYANPSSESVTGLSKDVLVGRNFLTVGIVNDPATMELMSEAMVKGESLARHEHSFRSGGEDSELEVMLSPISDEEGKVKKFVIVLRDVTQESKLEAQARQSQKLQAIGTLAGGIAHDFNNILSAILGYADLTLEDLSSDDTLARDNLKQVIDAANRAKDLVQQILTFSRQTGNATQLMQPQVLTKEVLKLIRATIKPMIVITAKLNVEDLSIRLDPSQYHQIVMNLMVNAAHAIGEEPGEIIVALDKVALADEQGILPELSEGEYICLKVEDTGCGMSPKVLDRIFEPFFTTKSVDEGTGMGLSAVHGIVSRYGGGVRVESEEGQGSCFEIYFPLAVSAAEGEEEESDFCPLHRGTGHILIVDDEDIQMEVMERMLLRLGYGVTKCGDSIKALEIFKTAPETFDAVITDYNMPNMKGDVFVGRLLEERKELPIIMCTGFSEQLSAEDAERIGVNVFLNKPIMTQDLDRALAKIFYQESVAKPPG